MNHFIMHDEDESPKEEKDKQKQQELAQLAALKTKYEPITINLTK